MNRVISFILGALVMFVIMFSIGMLKDDSIDISGTTNTSEVSEVQKKKADISKKIAFVNNDIGVGETNVAKSLIENMPMKNGYEVVTTTYNDAMSGIKSDQYAAYVMFDSSYSATLLSVMTDELPEKAKMVIKINSNLSKEQLIEVNQVLFADYMYIKDTINYIYIAYLLDIIHNTQDDVSNIIGNEEYMNSISKEVADYTLKVAESLDDYLKEPPSTEIELDLEGLQSLVEKNINQLSKQIGIDSEQLLVAITDAQTQFSASINESLLNSGLSVEELSVDLSVNEDINEDFNNLLMTKIENIYVQGKVLNDSLEILDGYVTAVNRMPELEDIKLITIFETMITASLQNDPNQLDEIADSYEFEVINNFILNYAQWYAGINEISLEACGLDSLDSLDPFGSCMAKFKSAYSLHFDDWAAKEVEFEQKYDAITLDYSLITSNINNVIDDIENILDELEGRDTDYISNILNGETTDENIETTNTYCNPLFVGENIVSNSVCNVYTGYKIIVNFNNQINDANGKIDEYNTQLSTSLGEFNTSIYTSNDAINKKLDDQQTATKQNIESKISSTNDKLVALQIALNETIATVNENKNSFITSVLGNLENYQTELNETIGSVEESQYDDRKNTFDLATSYNEVYAEAADSYTTNVSLLNLFASILPSTRNGNDANYYLYDYLVNPLEIILKAGVSDKEETLDPIADTDNTMSTQYQTGISKNIFIVIIIAFIVIVGLGVYMVFKNEDYDD